MTEHWRRTAQTFTAVAAFSLVGLVTAPAAANPRLVNGYAGDWRDLDTTTPTYLCSSLADADEYQSLLGVNVQLATDYAKKHSCFFAVQDYAEQHPGTVISYKRRVAEFVQVVILQDGHDWTYWVRGRSIGLSDSEY